MYKTIIELKREISDQDYEVIKQDIIHAFNNRVGKVANTSTDPYCFVFTGGENVFAKLDLGCVILSENELFWKWVKDWRWIDETDPDECCDVIKVYSTPVR
ncbi:MAG: hypothetical protein E7191_04720 [Erysipelotrichaceae bacterium]|nr:hypothetical protein [Erysipelotrichaceae bacterium]